MNIWLMIISIILANAFSVYEASNTPSNIQLILCINIIGNVVIFAIYWMNIQHAAKEMLSALDKLKNPMENLKPLEKIFMSKGIAKKTALHFEEMLGEEGWHEKIESPKNGDVYLVISEYKKEEKDMLGITTAMFNDSNNTWYAMNKKTHEFVPIKDIICFKDLESLPDTMLDQFKKGISQNGSEEI